MYLGEKFVNNQTLSDVTFLVENKEFFAHRIALLASSDIFRWVQQALASLCLPPCLSWALGVADAFWSLPKSIHFFDG